MLTENGLRGDKVFSSHILCGTSNTAALKSLINDHTLTRSRNASTVTSVGTVQCLHHSLTRLFMLAGQYKMNVWNMSTWKQIEPLRLGLSASRQW